MALAPLLLSACAPPNVLIKYDVDVPAQSLAVVGAPAPHDGRARFREIFCATLSKHPDRLNRGCDELLHRLPDEAPVASATRPLPEHDTALNIVLVPGVLSDCVKSITPAFGTAVRHLQSLGYQAQVLQVSGRSSSLRNAQDIAQLVSQLSSQSAGDLILVGHSKGAVDILEFLVAYPELAARVRAVISVAGAINGSPLGAWAAHGYDKWLRNVPLPDCPRGDGLGLASLDRNTRLKWLATHPLPQHIRYFSIGAFTLLDRVVAPLRPYAEALSRIDPRNDGQLLFYDVIIPGAELLGYANTDHWGIAIPIEDRHPILRVLLSAHDWYPRDVLMEALVLYAVETLKSGR